MAEVAEVAVAVDAIGVRQAARGTIALVGNPNAGKSSLFNRLTGMSQKTANYPGVTVERRVGRCEAGGQVVELIDLPGIFSLSPEADDERIAVDVLFGRMAGTPAPDAILAVVDSTRLYQGLYLVQQLLALGRPMAVVLTMSDAAEAGGVQVDADALGAALGGVTVFPVVATSGRGFPPMLDALATLAGQEPPKSAGSWPEMAAVVDGLLPILAAESPGISVAEVERVLVEGGPEGDGSRPWSADAAGRLAAARETLFGTEPPLAVEARARYRRSREIVAAVETRSPVVARVTSRLVDWVNQPWPATVIFVAIMAIVFQAVFSWATVFMDAIDAGMAAAGALVATILPDGVVESFVVDGVIAGVGSVIIFLPQILILFLFIIFMEDSGYLARAAFLVDRAMRSIGLSGQSVIPLLSSFACAVPSIMATRVIPNRRDRIATIVAAPFMTCSARLPVYALLIAAFVPQSSVGPLNLQGLVLFGLYGIGILGGVGTALLLKRTALRGKNPAFILALPEFRMPSLRNIAVRLLDRVRIFMWRAGTIIFTVAVIVWALAYFPRSAEIAEQRDAAVAVAEGALTGAALDERVGEIENEYAAAQLEQSWLGRAGHFVEPVFRPLGWDWRVSAAVIAGFPAREVVVAVLGTIYALGGEADEASLADRLGSVTWPDGSLVFTLPMVLGLLLFYAWCLQCAATLAVIRRETNSWRWPIFAWAYMTALGYLGALLIYQLGSA